MKTKIKFRGSMEGRGTGKIKIRFAYFLLGFLLVSFASLLDFGQTAKAARITVNLNSKKTYSCNSTYVNGPGVQNIPTSCAGDEYQLSGSISGSNSKTHTFSFIEVTGSGAEKVIFTDSKGGPVTVTVPVGSKGSYYLKVTDDSGNTYKSNSIGVGRNTTQPSSSATSTTTGVNSILKGQICEPDNDNSSNNLGRCINNIYIVALGLGGAIGFLMFVIAGYMYMLGSEESVKTAKSMVSSTFAGLIILFIGYALLNTIDPSLTKIPKLQGPPTVDCDKNPEACGIPPAPEGPGGAPGGSAAELKASAIIAQRVKYNGNITLATSHASGIGDNATAKQNIIDASAEKYSSRSNYTDSGKTGPGGSTSLNTTMLETLNKIGLKYTISVSEIAGGVHSSSESKHYDGKAFDINYINGVHLVPSDSRTKNLADAVITMCRSNGARLAQYEPGANHVHCDWN